MQMTQEIWNSLSADERARRLDVSALTPQLIGLEGWRVEVLDKYGARRRFIVGRSTGWKPCHIEISRRNAYGGRGAMGAPYTSVTKLYKVR